MNCGDYEKALDDYVDGTLDERARSACDTHLTTCDRCRTLVADLGALRQAASSLEPLAPPADVWRKLSALVKAERDLRPFAWGFTWQTLAASVVTLVLVASLSWVGARLATVNEPRVQALSFGAELDQLDEHFSTTIAGLESIRQTEGVSLDTETAEVLQANITVIDGAITESRAALATEPDNQVAQESLFEALRSKVELLQDVIALINEMRKGNP